MNKVRITTSWDDGHPKDLKLAELLAKYEIPATFYLPIKNPERRVMKDKEIRKLAKNFEIGSHSLNHKILTELSLEEAKKEIAEGKKRLENIIGYEVESFAYPSGKYNQEIKQLVGFSGFKYARTVSMFATSVGDKLLAPTTVHAYNHHSLRYLQHGAYRRLFYSLARSGNLSLDWRVLAKASFDWCLVNGGVYHLWGHSWEIEENNDWVRLEKILAYIAKKTTKTQRRTNSELLGDLEEEKRDYYQGLNPVWYSATYDTPYYRNELKLIKELTRDIDSQGKKVLDIGCGTGRVSTIVKKADYTGIDFAKNLIDFAKIAEPDKKFLMREFGKSHFTEATRGKYDLILVWGMFEDETSPFIKLEPIMKLIRKNGKIIFTLSNANNVLFRLSKYLKAEFFDHRFPITSYTSAFISEELKRFKQKGWRIKISSFGVVPPVYKLVPGLRLGKVGTTLVVILDKK